ncbi:MAG: carbohydrate kinase [Labilithrix sp.]
MESVDVACFGEILWDFYEAVPKEKEAISRSFKREIGGATANVAVTLAKLGIKSSVVGGIGDEKLGQALETQLIEEGVDVSHLIRVKAPTGIAFITHNATGDASYIPYRTGSAELMVQPSDIKPVMAKAPYVVVSTTSMMPSLRPATEAFLDAATKAKAVIVVDLNVRAHLWADPEEMQKGVKDLVLRGALIKASERDLNQLAGKRGLSWLDENAKHATWILTRGENGAACVGPHGQVNAPTKRVRCIDRSGAGDAFVGGVLGVLVKAKAKPDTDAWKDGKLWSRAMEIGHVLGAKSVAKIGATTGLTGLDDLIARLDAGDGPPGAKKKK